MHILQQHMASAGGRSPLFAPRLFCAAVELKPQRLAWCTLLRLAGHTCAGVMSLQRMPLEADALQQGPTP